MVELNRTQKDKAFSPNARRKSISNGFTVAQHNSVAACLPRVFRHAILLGEYNDVENDPNIAKIMRFGTPVVIDGKKALAFLTVKVSYQKRKEMGKPAVNEEVPRLYSLELDEIVMLGGQLKRLEYLQQNASSPSAEEIVINFNAKVKEYFDNVSKVVDENGEPLVTFSLSPTLLEDIGRARKRAKNADGSISQDGEMSRNAEVELCTMPDFMRYLGEPDVPVVARVFTLRKLLTDHNLTDELTYEIVEKMNDPVLAIQETPTTYLVLLDVLAENKNGVMAPVVCAVEHKKGKDGNRYLVSAYSLDNKKETKITEQFKKLVYCKYSTTAKFTADAPQGRAYELLRAAISGGHTSNVADLEDAVKFNQANFSASMEKASLQALDVLRTRADEREGERLMNDWQKACEGWAQLHVGDDDSRLGNGAKMLGEIYAPIGATKGVLPEKYTRMGHLNGLLRWAAVYANMQQTGEVPAEGVIAGPIYEKFVERMRYVDAKNEAYGLNDAEVKEAMALLAGERLDVAMLKVARECKRRLEMFLKDRERERIDWVVERAYPKRENGKRTPRGKMDAEAYRRMERAYRLMEMEANEVAGLMNLIKSALDKMKDEPAEAVEVLRSVRGGDVPGVDEVEALEAELVEFVFTTKWSYKSRLLEYVGL